MSEKLYTANKEFQRHAHITSMDEYKKLYEQSCSDTDAFWSRIGNEIISWFKPFTKVREFSYHDPSIRYFIEGRTNVAYNCLDRHLESRGDKIAIIWEGNEPSEDKKITYRELHKDVCKFANVLRSNGVKKVTV